MLRQCPARFGALPAGLIPGAVFDNRIRLIFLN
jgi:hypothetical protein